jgi:uncharacterized protein with PIN domain
MKKLSEVQAEQVQRMDAAMKAKAEEHKRDIKWVEEIISKDIPLYVREGAPEREIQLTEQFREGLRKQVIENKSFYMGEAYHKKGSACDYCGTELINRSPGEMTASIPPQVNISCIGCGWSGWLSI